MTGEELDAALKELGWNRTELAQRVGVSTDLAARWCSGYRGTKVPGPVAAFVGLAVGVRRLAGDLAPRKRRRPATWG
jgi:transcriptional regulator with XRE-family HTH domain